VFKFLRIALAVLGLVAVSGFFAAGPNAQAGATQNYIVLYRTTNAVPHDASAAIQKAGGSVVASYGQIGVVIARSSDAGFAGRMRRNGSVEGVSATTNFAVQLKDDAAADSSQGPPPGDLPNTPASDSDALSSLQWDMELINTPEAHAITGGSPSVVVGDIDTGLDYTHPDLAPNVDFANSVSCLSGSPDPDPAEWDDVAGHGTHTAGTIAAAANGLGIVGVAPNVKIAAIKAGRDDGYFFPEAVICAFMWAGARHLDVTNNSYFADPWLFNCRNDAEQRAIWKAERRAIRYAQSQGVLVVVAEGNENIDLSKRNVDTISPDFPPGSEVEREVTNACVVIPQEIPGVITVTAVGPNATKSFYSTYGVSVTDVAAPGGDSFQRANPLGRVLSTYTHNALPEDLEFLIPRNRVIENPPLCVNRVTFVPAPGCALWVYLQGTSMASPHAAGVAALIASRFGPLSPGRLAAMLNQTADPQECPPNPYDPTGDGAFEAHCTGGAGYNSFYGHGLVDALNAVTR